MKNWIKISLIFLCLLSSNYGNSQDIPVQEQWDANDYIIRFNITCENCNENQKSRIEKTFRDKLETRLAYNLLESYLIFKEENKFKFSIGEKEMTGTYVQKANDIILNIEDEQVVLKLKNLPEYRQILWSYGNEFLDAFKGSFELDDVGQVDIELTEMTIIYENVFDDPYDEYLFKKWEEETFEDEL